MLKLINYKELPFSHISYWFQDKMMVLSSLILSFPENYSTAFKNISSFEVHIMSLYLFIHFCHSYPSIFHTLLIFLKKILVTCSLLSPLPKLLLTSETLRELIQHYLRDAVLFQSTMFSIISILPLNLHWFCICPLFSVFVSNHCGLSFIPSFIILSIKSNHFHLACQCLLHSMQDSLNSLNFVFFSLFLLASLNPWITSNICINFYFWDAIIDKSNETYILAIQILLSVSAWYGHGRLRIWQNK